MAYFSPQAMLNDSRDLDSAEPDGHKPNGRLPRAATATSSTARARQPQARTSRARRPRRGRHLGIIGSTAHVSVASALELASEDNKYAMIPKRSTHAEKGRAEYARREGQGVDLWIER